MPRRTILITGASGRLGSALVHLLSPRHDVVQLDTREPEDPAQRAVGRFHPGSVTERDDVAAAMEGVDTVIHSAAIAWNSPPFDRLMNINVGGTVNLLEEAGARAEVERFVFISTIRVHGVLEAVRPEFMPLFLPFDESHPYLTREYYAGGKIHCEHWCRMYVERFRKPAVAIRPSWICSLPHEPEFKPRPTPDVPDLIQYVATTDLVDLIERAMEYHPPHGFDAFLAHGDEQFTATPSIEFVDRHFPGIPIDRAKLEACGGFGPLVDCTRAKERLGWSPKFRLPR
ncbi:MAG: NAD(P)-dependent oxidoreductase [bacterium]|nr:NAD(P)-dependent oxidoreductase [bacterium]